MNNTLSPSSQKFQDKLISCGFTNKVVEFEQITRTAKEAAQAIGCQVGQIAKSLIFKGYDTHTPILVIASGPNRVDEVRISELVGETIEKADADFAREKTGFVIGGIPPIGHTEKLKTFIDEDLLKYDEIWAAAGNPNAVFKLTPDDLLKMTGGSVIKIN